MPTARFNRLLEDTVKQLHEEGTAKGTEQVVTGVIPARNGRGPRFLLEGCGDREFLRMNSNSYLGLSLREDMLHAEEEGARKYGVGPGAVRFISGTYRPHVELEQRLAGFHGREACMISSAAYVAVTGLFAALTTPETIVVSDELNHNCIINGMRLARPKEKKIYKHLDMAELERCIRESVGRCENLIVVTDGVFSMRGVYAPLDEIRALVDRYNDEFPRDIVLLVDDSHGVGTLGETGRGTEELTGARCDILVATLGKAFGVNGGYIVADRAIIEFLREKNPFYIYTNPITPSEAAASLRALEILDSDEGKRLLAHLRAMTRRFEQGLIDLGYETLPSPHPVVPLMVRDTERTTRLVRFLHDNNILATGLNYPVVPRGDQSIRFQISAEHTEADIDYALDVLKRFKDEQ